MTEQSISTTDLTEMLENSLPFNGLETQYLQRQYYKENFRFLVSKHCMNLLAYMQEKYHAS